MRAIYRTQPSPFLLPLCAVGTENRDKILSSFGGGRIAAQDTCGGMDQYNVLTTGTHAQIRNEVHRLYEGFGRDGGYILSASDPIFDAPVENLKVFGEAAREGVY